MFKEREGSKCKGLERKWVQNRREGQDGLGSQQEPGKPWRGRSVNLPQEPGGH